MNDIIGRVIYQAALQESSQNEKRYDSNDEEVRRGGERDEIRELGKLGLRFGEGRWRG